MRIFNEAGRALLIEFESLRLDVYLDQGDRPTVGYGHLITNSSLKLGDTIERAAADDLLDNDISNAEKIVLHYIDDDVLDFMTDNQYSACVCFAFNAGYIPFSGKFGQLMNDEDIDAVAEDFVHWDHVRINGKLVESAGLKRRCEAERDLFLKNG